MSNTVEVTLQDLSKYAKSLGPKIVDMADANQCLSSMYAKDVHGFVKPYSDFESVTDHEKVYRTSDTKHLVLPEEWARWNKGFLSDSESEDICSKGSKIIKLVVEHEKEYQKQEAEKAKREVSSTPSPEVNDDIRVSYHVH